VPCRVVAWIIDTRVAYQRVTPRRPELYHDGWLF